MIIEINGLKFQKKPTKQPKHSRQMALLTAVSAAMGAQGLTRDGTSKGVEINIEEEYGLIQLKKSNLSSNKRAWVVFMFESQYELAPKDSKV